MPRSSDSPLHLSFAGLPGVGKTTIAREFSRRLPAVYLRIDSLEQALADSGLCAVHELGPAGYHAAAAIATDNLTNGLSIVSDSVNPFAATRDIWREATERAGAVFVGIEVICSDANEHQRRVETRDADIAGFVLPDWPDVLAREYILWGDAALRLDTAGTTPEQAVGQILEYIAHWRNGRPEVVIRRSRPDESASMLEIWERSVRTSHRFLGDEDIAGIRPQTAEALSVMEVYVAELEGRPAGFMGLNGDMVEMLFIDPDRKGRGLGSRLLDWARRLRPGRILRLDVNEQNPDAIAFYRSRGFRQIGRSDTDSAGRPFPLLHLEDASTTEHRSQ